MLNNEFITEFKSNIKKLTNLTDSQINQLITIYVATREKNGGGIILSTLDKVKMFHKEFKIPILSKPTLIEERRHRFRYHLMKEELKEYVQACSKGDIEKICDSIADLLYSVYGTALEQGINETLLSEIIDEVHKSNMTKEYAEFKIIKGINYKPPNIQDIIVKHTKTTSDVYDWNND